MTPRRPLPHDAHGHDGRRRMPAWARWRAVPWLSAVLLAGLAVVLLLELAPAGGEAGAAEFITPPGLNVEGQEAVLKEQVQQIAKGLVGEALVEVIAHVRYIRTDGKGGRRIKLPGVNHYISAGAGGGIVAGHARVRQIVVMVKDTVDSTPSSLEEELRQQGRFDPGKGDLVRVIKVEPPAEGGKAGKDGKTAAQAGDGLGEDAKALARRLQNKEDDAEAMGRKMAQGSLAEAQATTYLIKARQAYFNGNYDRTLDQILQSIAQNPNNPQAYAMLGSLYYAVDWKQLALKYWEKSLTLDPGNREIQELVARLRSSPSN